MNSGPSPRMRSIRSSKFCSPCEDMRFNRGKHAEPCCADLSSPGREVLEGPPDFVVLGRLLDLLADFHDEPKGNREGSGGGGEQGAGGPISYPGSHRADLGLPRPKSNNAHVACLSAECEAMGLLIE